MEEINSYRRKTGMWSGNLGGFEGRHKEMKWSETELDESMEVEGS